MEDLLLDLATKLGLGAIPTTILGFMIRRSTEHRKEERNAEIHALENRVKVLESRNDKIDDFLHEEIKRLYDVINPLAASVSYIRGVLESKRVR